MSMTQKCMRKKYRSIPDTRFISNGMKYENTPIEERKYHYRRGFRAACVVLAPFIVALTVAVHILLDITI